ncbi:hypothetical protein QTN47_02585 [Danxiaibacter flavus]|uniref:Uncharacterized protein n=1 Tax=Danxiaibacter flavus TaxID=3049108 RepID=A0ABV3Z9T8_9BACT|nr:hypothetical protein QNM32_02585 [Chitinophagaceae bacterium DXS]
MDRRSTLGQNGSFLQILTVCFNEKQRADLLFDDNGLTRASGYIRLINGTANAPYLEMEDGQKISIRSIVAVNGTFSDNYCEC